MPPFVSVGMPIFNGARYAPAAIDSVLAQTFGDWELVICDNASTDDTESLCRSYAQRDPRIKYFRNPENLGAHPNYGLAFARSQGRYFKWAAHDDYLDPNALARCVAVLDAHDDVVVAYPRVVDVAPEGDVLTTYDGGAGGRAPRPSPHVRGPLDARGQGHAKSATWGGRASKSIIA